jgi:ketopantoate reductase
LKITHETNFLVNFLFQSDTLNPFDQNGQIFANNLNGNKCDDEKENENEKERKDDENNVVLSVDQLSLLEDQREELSDLRRQVVYLQVGFLSSSKSQIKNLFKKLLYFLPI